MRTDLRYIYYGYVMVFMLISPVVIVSPTKGEEKICGDVSTVECLQKLQTFLKLKSLPFTSEEAKLNTLCRDTVAGYNCSVTKTSVPNCLSTRDKDLFPIFVDMAQHTMIMFCTTQNGEDMYAREDLLKNSECIMKQKNALDCCAEASKLPDFPVLHVMEPSSKSTKERQMEACCPIANYLKCALRIVEENCGEDAANLTRMYVRSASGEPVEAMCQKMPDYPELNSEICEVPSVVCSGSRIGVLLELVTIMCFIFITRMSYM